ncbi:hypothetical protein RINTHM_870 [Richelia intracellularis HM01]|nr:hypothetical protein RINTHM_870 [Richelia intracellularis HM01]
MHINITHPLPPTFLNLEGKRKKLQDNGRVLLMGAFTIVWMLDKSINIHLYTFYIGYGK